MGSDSRIAVRPLARCALSVESCDYFLILRYENQRTKLGKSRATVREANFGAYAKVSSHLRNIRRPFSSASMVLRCVVRVETDTTDRSIEES